MKLLIFFYLPIYLKIISKIICCINNHKIDLLIFSSFHLLIRWYKWDKLAFNLSIFQVLITLQQHQPLFIFKPLQKRRVLILSIIAAWCDHVTWWNFTSWCCGGASHDPNHDLIMRPKMCLTWYSFLFRGGRQNIYKRE